MNMDIFKVGLVKKFYQLFLINKIVPYHLKLLSDWKTIVFSIVAHNPHSSLCEKEGSDWRRRLLDYAAFRRESARTLKRKLCGSEVFKFGCPCFQILFISLHWKVHTTLLFIIGLKANFLLKQIILSFFFLKKKRSICVIFSWSVKELGFWTIHNRSCFYSYKIDMKKETRLHFTSWAGKGYRDAAPMIFNAASKAYLTGFGSFRIYAHLSLWYFWPHHSRFSRLNRLKTRYSSSLYKNSFSKSWEGQTWRRWIISLNFASIFKADKELSIVLLCGKQIS